MNDKKIISATFFTREVCIDHDDNQHANGYYVYDRLNEHVSKFSRKHFATISEAIDEFTMRINATLKTYLR